MEILEMKYHQSKTVSSICHVEPEPVLDIVE